MPILPVNFTDDILSEGMNGRRRYRMIQNDDGTVSFEDVSEYDQVGSNFGAAQINQSNDAINNAADSLRIVNDLETINAITEEGYIAGTLPIKELSSKFGNSGSAECLLDKQLATTTPTNYTVSNLSNYKFIFATLEYTDYDNDVFGSQFIPVSIFKIGKSHQIRRYVDADMSVNIKYINDTTISLLGHLNTINCCSIYGIK